MPGKVNPTQSEAVIMSCCQVMGNDVAINFGGAMGNLELNAMKPLIIHNFLQSVRLLSDGMTSFNDHCAKGITANRERIDELMRNSLMLVTALTPYIGYEKSTEIANLALATGDSVYEIVLQKGYLTKAALDEILSPENMTRPRYIK